MRLNDLDAGCGGAALIATPASADTVTDWWETAHRYWLAGQGMPGPRSPDAERAATRATLAMFEAVNAIDRRYESYLGIAAGDRTASQDAAAATAAYKVLLKHYPAEQGGAGGKLHADAWRRSAATAPREGRAGDRRAGGRGGDERQRHRSGGRPAPYRPRTVAGRVGGDRRCPSLDAYWAALKPWVDPQRRCAAPAAAAGADQRALCPGL